MPSPASAPASPPSASQSQNSATQPSPREHLTDAATNNDGLLNAEEKKPDLLDQFEDFDHFNSAEKYKKYEADYAQRLMAKYYSKRNLYGGNVFEENKTIDNKIIKSSKWPCTRSFADPVQGFEDHRSSRSTSAMERCSPISNGKLVVKKNG